MQQFHLAVNFNRAERVELSSLVMDMLREHLKHEHFRWESLSLRNDGDYIIVQKDKKWSLKKIVAKDCAIGRISLSNCFPDLHS